MIPCLTDRHTLIVKWDTCQDHEKSCSNIQNGQRSWFVLQTCCRTSLMICNLILSSLTAQNSKNILWCFHISIDWLISISRNYRIAPFCFAVFSPLFFAPPSSVNTAVLDASLWCCCLDAVIIVCLQRDAPCLCPGWHRRIQTANAAAHLHSFIHFPPSSPSRQGNDKLNIFILTKTLVNCVFLKIIW